MWPTPGVADDEKLGRAEAVHVMRRAGRMLRPYRRQMAAAAVSIVVFTASVLAGPYLVRHAIDQGIAKGDRGPLNAAVVGYVIVAVVMFLSVRFQVAMVGRIGEGFLRDVRLRAFDHLQRLPLAWHDKNKAGVVVSRLTSDIDSLAELVQMGLLMFVSNALLLVVSVVVLGLVSWQLLLVALVSVPFVALASVKFQRESNRAYLLVRDRIGQTLSSLQEGLTGVRVIQGHARERRQVESFTRTSGDLYEAHMESVKVSAWYLPIVEGAGVLTTAATLAVGGWLVFRGDVTIGTVTFFVLTLSNLFEPLNQLSQLFNIVQSAGAGLHKLFDLIDTAPAVPEPERPVPLPAGGDVVLDRVSFRYGDGPLVLADVSLTVAAGERLAVVGPTGAGKSTVAKLVARLYDPTSGAVTIGGVDLREVVNADLRRHVCVVPQEGFLFAGSIRDNVRIGRGDATDAEVDAALEACGVLERFASLPEGLDTPVRERGSRLSAGERQLVSLARAALADPEVLVLDEATSSLDPGTERLVEQALERLVAGRTVIVIAHRLTTAERADRVAVVDGGRLVEIGTHDELVDAGGRYSELFANWTGGLAAAG
jgi:ATP-binding cassette, subfamily B, bacterial